MADLRMYCSEQFKRTMKSTAAEKGMSISDLLTYAVNHTFPHLIEKDSDYRSELESITKLLATNGGTMTPEERQKIKSRKKELQRMIEEGRCKNGRD